MAIIMANDKWMRWYRESYRAAMKHIQGIYPTIDAAWNVTLDTTPVPTEEGSPPMSKSKYLADDFTDINARMNEIAYQREDDRIAIARQQQATNPAPALIEQRLICMSCRSKYDSGAFNEGTICITCGKGRLFSYAKLVTANPQRIQKF
jgi:hypothetical protein